MRKRLNSRTFTIVTLALFIFASFSVVAAVLVFGLSGFNAINPSYLIEYNVFLAFLTAAAWFGLLSKNVGGCTLNILNSNRNTEADCIELPISSGGNLESDKNTNHINSNLISIKNDFIFECHDDFKNDSDDKTNVDNNTSVGKHLSVKVDDGNACENDCTDKVNGANGDSNNRECANNCKDIGGANIDNSRLKADLINNLPAGVIAFGGDGKVLYCNNAICKVFNTDMTVGASLHDFLSDRSLADKIIETARADNKESFTYNIGDKFYRIEIFPIVNVAAGADNCDNAAVFTDITAETLNEKMRSEFFANATHELKTPITATLGFSELLLMSAKLDETLKPQVENIYRNSVRMHRLIQDMLELSRLDAGIVSEEPTTVDLREIIDFAVNTLTPRAEESNLQFKTRGNAVFCGKYKQTEQIIMNLLSNAVKYNTPNGKIYIDIKKADNGVIIKVRDTGKGISESDLPRIFERFYCVDKGKSRNTGASTGLGLAIVRQIIKQNGGQITVQSIYGKATQFTVVLPIINGCGNIDTAAFPKYRDDEFDIEENDVFGVGARLRKIDDVVSIYEYGNRGENA